MCSGVSLNPQKRNRFSFSTRDCHPNGYLCWQKRSHGFDSKLLTIPKPNKDVWPILNLKGLQFLNVQTFRIAFTRQWLLHQEDFLMVVKDSNPDILIFQLHQLFLWFAVKDCHFQYSTLIFGLPTAPGMFTKVWILVLVLLRTWGVLVVGYLHNLLFREQSAQNVKQTVKDLDFRNSALVFTHLAYLGLVFDIAVVKVLIPWEECLSLWI